MKQALFELPTMAFVIATRAALAAGVAMLVTAGYTEGRRRQIGRALVAVGAVTTVPAAMAVARAVRRGRAAPIGRSAELIGATRFPRKAGDEVLPPDWDAADLDEAEDLAPPDRDWSAR